MKNIRIPSFLPWLLTGLFIFGVGLFFRLYPLTHNVAADAYEKSTIIVLNRIQALIAQQIDRQLPNLPAFQKEALIKKQFDEVLRKDKDKVRKAFDDLGLKILEQEGGEKHYLQESDSYYFLALTQNVLDRGSIGTAVKGSKYFNALMLAPIGYWQPNTWHPYIGAAVYKIVKFFKPDADVVYGVGFTPLFLLPLVIAAFLFACRGMECSWPSALTAAVFFVLAPIYLKRSTYAWYDDDTYSVLFPILTLAFLFFALRYWGQAKKAVLYAIGCALAVVLYSLFWMGWGFLAGLIFAGLFVILIKRQILRDAPAVDSLKVSGVLLAAMAVGVLAMFGFKDVVEIIAVSWGELLKFTAPKLKDWPDLFIVVGELKRLSLGAVISETGGIIPFTGALGVLAYSAVNVIRKRTVDEPILILAVFLTATLVMSLGALRFTVLCLTPVSLLFAVALEKIWQARKKIILPMPRKSVAWMLVTIFLLSLFIPWQASNKNIRSLLNPIFNSAWDRALTKLRDETPPDSVIDTWWSPGHFVKAVAKRKVSFDGATIKGDVAYWLNRVYLSQSEEEALGILRMLNTSSNSAAEYLQKSGLPLSKAVPFLSTALKMDKDKARTFYSKALPPKEAAELLALTHGTPPPSYLLIYNEIVEGNIMLGYIGKWDFEKIERLNRDPELLKKVPSRSSPGYIDFLWSLVGGPYHQSETLSPVVQKENEILFTNGVKVNTTDMTAEVASPKFGSGIPHSIFYLDNGEVREKKLANATLDYSILFFHEDNGAPRAVLMDRILANSLIMKLYFFDGKGLKYFKPFAKERDITGRTKIFIYEVRWPENFRK
jgi:dolichyl-diphosphooligosaccharide--protein glycosyltransferase